MVNNCAAEEIRNQNPVNEDMLLKKTTPVSRVFGLDRGTPIDRYYIDRFLDVYCTGLMDKSKTYNTLEIGGRVYSEYLKKQCEGVTFFSDVLDYKKGEDLTDFSTLKKEYYDLFICTQTFNFIYDIKKAISGAYYTLNSGGILLATVAGTITPISRYDMNRWGHYWGFTDLSAKKIFSDVFGEDNVSVTAYGNVMAATAFVQGVAIEDLSDLSSLDYEDDDYQIILGIICLKK